MEKFQTFRRGKVVLFCACFLTALVLFVIACHKDSSIPAAPTISPLVLEIKDWFENKIATNKQSSITNRTNLNFEPRWGEAQLIEDVVEIPTNENGNLAFPIFADSPLKLGKKFLITRFVNNERQGAIMSFVPTFNFSDQMKNLTSQNFREINFDGIITFQEFDGRFIGAYLVENGVVQKKLEIRNNNGISARDACYQIVTEYWVISGGTETYQGIGAVGPSICPPPSYGGVSYDSGMSGGSTSSGSSVGGTSSGGDALYNSYLNYRPVVTNMCARSVSDGFDRLNYQYGPVTAGPNNGCLPNNSVHGTSAQFRNLQVPTRTGIDIPYFTISIETRANININNATIGNMVATAYNSIVNTYNGNLSGQAFMTAWTNEFSRGNSNNYCMSFEIHTSQTNVNLNDGVVLQNRSGACQ
jgi:uncharacterized membrane protein YgcG